MGNHNGPVILTLNGSWDDNDPSPDDEADGLTLAMQLALSGKPLHDTNKPMQAEEPAKKPEPKQPTDDDLNKLLSTLLGSGRVQVIHLGDVAENRQSSPPPPQPATFPAEENNELTNPVQALMDALTGKKGRNYGASATLKMQGILLESTARTITDLLNHPTAEFDLEAVYAHSEGVISMVGESVAEIYSLVSTEDQPRVQQLLNGLGQLAQKLHEAHSAKPVTKSLDPTQVMRAVGKILQKLAQQ